MDEREVRRAEVLVEHARVVHVLEQNAARRVARVARRVLVELLRVEQRAAAARERVRLAAALGVVGVEPRCQPPQHAAGEGDEEALGVWKRPGEAGQQALHHVARNELRVGGVPKRAGRTPEGSVRRRGHARRPRVGRVARRVPRRQLPAARAVREAGRHHRTPVPHVPLVERAKHHVLRGRRAPQPQRQKPRRDERVVVGVDDESGEKRAVARRGARGTLQKRAQQLQFADGVRVVR